MTTAPTGRQLTITHGEQVAVVTEVGATLRTYEVGGRAVVDGFPADRRPDGGRGQVLAPWPNRIADGRYDFGGEQHQLPLTEVAAGNAIHGLVRWVGWEVLDQDVADVMLGTTVWPQPGYPFLLRLRASYRIDDAGLHVRLHARNDGDRPAPYGAGHHPYVTVGEQVDACRLTVPARRRVVTDHRGNPVGEEEVAGGAYDFRAPRRIGELELDTCFSDLSADPACAVVLEGRDRAVTVRLGAGARHVQVFSGDTLPDPSRRRQGLAVEPMTCPPGSFRSGTDLVVLDPGAEHVLGWGIEAR